MTDRRSLTAPFVGIALVVALAVVAGTEPPVGVQVLGLAVVVALVGLPHGALDPVVAHDAGIVTGPRAVGRYLVGYVGLALVTAAAWLAAPSIALPLFFVVSALHFGGDWPGLPAGVRALAGAAVVLTPVAFHADEAASLLEPLADAATADRIVAVSGVVGPVAAASAFGLAVITHRSIRAGVEIATIVALAAVAPPLIAFATYFCALHSPRHIGAVLHRTRVHTRTAVGVAAALTVATVVAAASVWPMLESSASIDDAAVRLVFVGLAALTVPHMATIERARRSEGARPRTTAAATATLQPAVLRSTESDRKELP